MLIGKVKVASAVLLTTVTLGSASTLYGYRMLTNITRQEDTKDNRAAIIEKEPPNALIAKREFEPSNNVGKDDDVDANSLAQASEDDNNGGFGFGFGSGSSFGSGQGMGFGMGSSSGGNKLSTLSQKPVQRELTLSDKQLKKLRELQTKQQRTVRAMAPKNPLEAFNDPGATMNEMQQAPEKMKKLTKEIDAAIDEMLTEKQSKRLREIWLQQLRGHAFDDPEVAETLKITDEQRKQIRNIQAGGMKKMQDLGFQTIGNLFRAGPNPAAFQQSSKDVSKQLQQIWNDTGDQLLGILTSEQKSIWNELTGKPFKVSSPTRSR